MDSKSNSIANYGAIAALITGNDVQNDLATIKPSKPADMLSDCEWEVLSLVGNEATNHETAQK